MITIYYIKKYKFQELWKILRNITTSRFLFPRTKNCIELNQCNGVNILAHSLTCLLLIVKFLEAVIHDLWMWQDWFLKLLLIPGSTVAYMSLTSFILSWNSRSHNLFSLTIKTVSIHWHYKLLLIVTPADNKFNNKVLNRIATFSLLNFGETFPI